jgi:uncharacterized protein (TIRG00374 family)
MKSALQGVGGLLLAAVLLYWVFHDKDPQALRNALLQVAWPLLAMGTAINLGHNVFRVLRWRWLLDPVRPDVPMRPLFAAVILGYMTTFVGGRVGEVVRPALLSAKEDLPLGACLGSVVADRLLDGVAIVVLFAFGSMGAHFTQGSAELAGKIRFSAVAALLVMVVGLIAFVAMSTVGNSLDVWLSRRWAPVRWLGRAALGLSRGAEALRSPRRAFPILAYSLLAWFTIGIGTWLGIRAVGATIGFADVFVMLPLLALGVSLPTPGGVGGYHALMPLGLTSLFGVDPTIAASAGILMHLAIFLPILTIGPLLLYTENVSLADLMAAARKVRALGHQTAPVEAAS